MRHQSENCLRKSVALSAVSAPPKAQMHATWTEAAIVRRTVERKVPRFQVCDLERGVDGEAPGVTEGVTVGAAVTWKEASMVRRTASLS